MKVLLLSPLPPPSGGMARWTELYIKGAADANIKVQVVNTNISKNRASTRTRSISVIDEVRRTWNILSVLSVEIRNFKPDLIHICSPCSRYGLLRDYLCVKKAGTIPSIFHCHCNVSDQARTKISRFVLKKIIKKCRRIFALNSTSLQFLDSLVPGKTIYVPNFYEEENIYRSHAANEELREIIYVGHVKLKKGIEEIYQIAKRLPEKHFTVVGPIQELPKWDKPANIVLLGEVSHEKVRKLLDESDLFLFPSHTEGFANVMLEAMAAGLPIVASDVGSNKDMVEKNGGVITAVGDYEGMIEAICSLESCAIREKISEWNQTKIRDKYTVSMVMRIIKEAYIEVTK